MPNSDWGSSASPVTATPQITDLMAGGSGWVPGTALSATTGTFSGLLSAGAGLNVTGTFNASGTLNANGTLVVGGSITPGTYVARFLSTTGDRLRIASMSAGSGVIIDCTDAAETVANHQIAFNSPISAQAITLTALTATSGKFGTGTPVGSPYLAVCTPSGTPSSLFMLQNGQGSGHIGFRASDSALYLVNSYATGAITDGAYAKLYNSGFFWVQGLQNTDDAFERVILGAYFTNATPNLAQDIRLGNSSFTGFIEVEITSTYSNQNAAGRIQKVFAFGCNPSNAIWENESRVVDVVGRTPDNFSIGEISWDAVNTCYRIPISHISSLGNPYTLRVRAVSQNGSATTLLNAITMGPQYSLTALSRNQVTFNEQVLFGGTILMSRAIAANDWNAVNIANSGSWSGASGYAALVNVTDGTGTVGSFGIGYNGGGYFVVKNLYHGGYAGSGEVFKVDDSGFGYLNGSLILTLGNVGSNAATLQAAVASSNAPCMGTNAQMLAYAPPAGTTPYWYATDVLNTTDSTYGALFHWNGSTWGSQLAQANVIAPKITAGVISAGAVGAVAMATGSITATNGIIASLDCSKITTGTMNASFITAGTITSTQINAASISAAILTAGSITAGMLTSTLVLTSVIQSNNYVAGTSTTIGTGFKFSGNTWTGTATGGATYAVNGEIGGGCLINGVQVGSLNFGRLYQGGGTTLDPGTYTLGNLLPPNIYGSNQLAFVEITICGGGAGGTGSNGGGGAACLTIVLQVSSLTAGYTIVVGAAGSASSNGGDSSINGTTWVAGGGKSTGVGGAVTCADANGTWTLPGGSVAVNPTVSGGNGTSVFGGVARADSVLKTAGTLLGACSGAGAGVNATYHSGTCPGHAFATYGAPSAMGAGGGTTATWGYGYGGNLSAAGGPGVCIIRW